MSPVFNVNVDEVEDLKPLPEGVYEATVFNIEGPKSGPKSDYLVWIFEIQDEDHQGRRLYHNTPVNGKGAGIFINVLSAVLGGDKLSKEDIAEMEMDSDEWIGNEVLLQIRHEIYEGETRSKVARVMSAG